MNKPKPMRWPADFPGKHDKQEKDAGYSWGIHKSRARTDPRR